MRLLLDAIALKEWILTNAPQVKDLHTSQRTPAPDGILHTLTVLFRYFLVVVTCREWLVGVGWILDVGL
jgi:hypothetical protein